MAAESGCRHLADAIFKSLSFIPQAEEFFATLFTTGCTLRLALPVGGHTSYGNDAVLSNNLLSAGTVTFTLHRQYSQQAAFAGNIVCFPDLSQSYGVPFKLKPQPHPSQQPTSLYTVPIFAAARTNTATDSDEATPSCSHTGVIGCLLLTTNAADAALTARNLKQCLLLSQSLTNTHQTELEDLATNFSRQLYASVSVHKQWGVLAELLSTPTHSPTALSTVSEGSESDSESLSELLEQLDEKEDEQEEEEENVAGNMLQEEEVAEQQQQQLLPLKKDIYTEDNAPSTPRSSRCAALCAYFDRQNRASSSDTFSGNDDDDESRQQQREISYEYIREVLARRRLDQQEAAGLVDSCHPLTLRFKDSNIERQFWNWRSEFCWLLLDNTLLSVVLAYTIAQLLPCFISVDPVNVDNNAFVDTNTQSHTQQQQQQQGTTEYYGYCGMSTDTISTLQLWSKVLTLITTGVYALCLLVASRKEPWLRSFVRFTVSCAIHMLFWLVKIKGGAADDDGTTTLDGSNSNTTTSSSKDASTGGVSVAAMASTSGVGGMSNNSSGGVYIGDSSAIVAWLLVPLSMLLHLSIFPQLGLLLALLFSAVYRYQVFNYTWHSMGGESFLSVEGIYTVCKFVLRCGLLAGALQWREWNARRVFSQLKTRREQQQQQQQTGEGRRHEQQQQQGIVECAS